MKDRKKYLLNHLEMLCRRQLHIQPGLRRAIEGALANPMSYSEDQIAGLTGLLESSLRRNSNSPHIFDSSSYPIVNGFKIGRAIDTGKVISVSPNLANRHIFLAGGSGAGKTNLMNVIIGQASGFDGLSYLIIDLKDDYKVHMASNRDVLVINWDELKLNPLRPPIGVNYLFWMNVFTDIFSDIFGLAISSKGGLLETLANLYHEFGIDEGSDNYPSLFCLKDYLSRVQYSSSMQIKALKNRLSTMLLTTGKVFDCSHGFSLEKLTSSKLIIRLHGLVEELQNFFLVYLLTWLFNYRIYSGIRNQGLSLLVFVDECKRLFSKTLESKTGSAVASLSDSMGKVREFGIGIIAADQEISKISRSLLANTYTKIIFDLNLGQDQDAITKAVGLNSAQKEIYFRGLGIGRAIIKSAANPPCLVEIPYHPIKEAQVSEEERVRRMQPFLNRLYDDVIEVKDMALKVADGETKGNAPKENQSNEQQISDKARGLLSDICRRPYEFVTQRMNSLKMSPTTFSKAKKDLIRRGLVEEATIKTGSERGKTAKFLIPTTEGYRLIGEKPPAGKGGAKHKFFAGAVYDYLLAQKYQPEIELFHNGKSVDVGYMDNEGKLIAVEITCALKNLIENIEKDFEAGFKEVAFVFEDSETEDKARTLIEGSVDEEKMKLIRLQQISRYF